ncbi:MAG: T9SS type A sorting domain-containing protein [candidate division Zixibacteria bacterium]|nr:T9SS type A sorting domain-containing protein [candidate division Zixibacteria bacterium]
MRYLITFLVTIMTVLVGGFAYAQGPDLTPLSFLSGNDAIGPAAGDQVDPDIARGDGMYLAVWTDSRTSLLATLVETQSESDIYAARIDFDGNLIDSIPIIVDPDGGAQENPEVHWNGENWLVVWESQKLNPQGYYYSAHIMAARVSPQGEVIDSPPITVYEYPWSTSAMFSATAAGDGWAVISQGTSGGEADTRGFRIASDGTVLDPNGIVVLEETYYLRFDLNISFAQDEYLVVWEGGRIKGIRLDTELQWIDSGFFNIGPASALGPQLTSNGADFLVGFVNSTYAHVARVSYEGEVLDPNGIQLGNQSVGGSFTRVAWDGNVWFGAWGETWGGMYAARIDTSGNVLDPGGEFYPGLDVDAITTGINGGIMVVYEDMVSDSPTPSDIFVFRLYYDMTRDDEYVASQGAPSQTNPRIAGDDAGWMATFLSHVSDNRRVMVHALEADGSPSIAEPVEVASGNLLSKPSIAYNGSLYMVTWHDGDVDSIYARRVSPDGTPIDTEPITIMRGFEADVAAVGDTFLVVAIDKTINIEFIEPFSVRVRGSDGAILDPSPVDIGSSFAQSPRVTSFGNKWLATWERFFSHDDPHDEVMGAFVNPDGSASNDFTVIYGSYRYGPVAAASPDTGLIVWHDDRMGNPNWNLYAKRILPSGGLLDGNGFPISPSIEEQEDADLSWDGSQFVVLFEDHRNKDEFFDKRTDIYGARVNSAGEVIDPNGFVFANEEVPEMQPAVASANDVSVLSGALFFDSSPYAAYRIGLRMMGLQQDCSEVAMVPDDPPVEAPPGGSFGLTGTVTNPNTESITTDVWVGVKYADDFYHLQTFPGINLDAGESLNAHFNQNVPGYAPAGNYQYVAYSGNYTEDEICDSASFEFTVTGSRLADGASEWILDGEWLGDEDIPTGIELNGNYPNPFNAQTSINFSLPSSAQVSLEIYNLMGQKLQTLIDGYREAGQHTASWNAANYSSGIYLYKLQVGDQVYTLKMSLLK